MGLWDNYTDLEKAGTIGGAAGLFGGLFGDSGDSYQAAMDQMQKYGQMGADVQKPWLEAGQRGMGRYEDWLAGQKDPSGFINNMMGQYQISPYAKFQMQQGQNAANNAASASGMLGSTPFMQASQDYARNIASQDQNQWLQNVLGVNTQYGQGQQNLMQGGQNAANSLTNLYSNLGQSMGEQAYNKNAAGKNDMWNAIGGAASLAMFL